MELFKIKRDIPFMSYGKLTTFISLVTFIAAVFFLITKGLNFSVEFTGGTVMEVQYQQGVDVNKTREKLDTLKMGDVQVQALGTNKHIMIRLPNKEGVTSAQLSNQVMELLKKEQPDVTLRQVEFIGPQVGEGRLIRYDRLRHPEDRTRRRAKRRPPADLHPGAAGGRGGVRLSGRRHHAGL